MASGRAFCAAALLVALLAVYASARELQQTTTKPAAAVVLPGASNALCVGPIAPAKFRFQWAYEMKDPTPKNIAAIDALVQEWMKGCRTTAGGNVVRYGQGGALTKKPADFGYAAAPPKTAVLADYGAWSDWRSLEDLTKCYDSGRASGVLAKIRTYSKTAARVVFPLSSVVGNTQQKCASAASLAPATARFQVFYVLNDETNAGFTQVSSLFAKISAVTPLWIRRGIGADEVKTLPIYGAGVARTANYGLFRDFASIKDMTDDLGSPAAKPDVAKLRSLSSKSMRVLIPLTLSYP